MSPSRIDRAIIQRHLTALDAALAQLQRHRGVSLDELRADDDTKWIVERGLQLCAQNTLGIATHLAAATGRDAPDDASVIDQLASIGLLDGAFARQFRALAALRDTLVHAYLEVDLELLHTVLQHRLADFETFGDAVRAHVTGS